MIDIFEKRWNESVFADHPSIKLQKLDEWTNIENEEGVRNLALVKANNESLPFEDASFDAYIANLSLMLVDNHKNMLSEAYRVLKSGCYAGFSVWGSEENSNAFRFVKNTLKNLGYEFPEGSRTHFHLNDKKKLK